MATRRKATAPGLEAARKEATRLGRGLEDVAVVAQWEAARAGLAGEAARREAEDLRRAEAEARELVSRLGRDIEVMTEKREAEVAAQREVARSGLQAAQLEAERARAEEAARWEEEGRAMREVAATASGALLAAQEEALVLRRSKEQLEAKVAALVVSVMAGSEGRDATVLTELRQEVASLQVVLDIKTRQLKAAEEARNRLKVQQVDYDALKEEIKTVKNQNEDLKTQVNMKKTSERSLEVEMQRLQSSLKKEVKEKRRLSMEKEQLEWRVREATPPAAARSFSESRSSPRPLLTVPPFVTRLRRSSTDLHLLDTDLHVLDATADLKECNAGLPEDPSRLEAPGRQ